MTLRMVLCLALCAALAAGLAHAQSEVEPAAIDGWPDVSRDPLAASPTLTLAFMGDIKFEGRTARRIAQHGVDYPLALVAEHIRSSDIAFGNLETAITDYPRSTPGKSLASIQAMQNFIFKSSPAYSDEILAAAGFDIVSLANNHAMDYCAEGLAETMLELDSSGIRHAGAGLNHVQAAEPAVLETGGRRVGFLAYSMIVPAASQAFSDRPGINAHERRFSERMANELGKLQALADMVVVSVHWGVEGALQPAAYQRDVGHALIDTGADLVIGHHTHTVQGVEFYNGGLIAYSLGNFVFTGASPKLPGVLLEVTAGPGGDISSARVLPCWINDGRPEPSLDPALLQRLAGIMQSTGTTVTPDGEWLRLEAAP